MDHLIWVQLPDLRRDCIRVVDDMVAVVGKIYLRPKPEEFRVRGHLPKFGVRVSVVKPLPPSVEVKVDEAETETIIQKFLYPGMKTHFEICGSPEHLKDECTVTPYLVALVRPDKSPTHRLKSTVLFPALTSCKLGRGKGSRKPVKTQQ